MTVEQSQSRVFSGPRHFLVRLACPGDRAAIVRFNERLAAGGSSYHMPLHEALPGGHLAPLGYFVYRRQLLVFEDEEVRGGVLMQHHRLSLRGHEQPFCWLQLPLTEGLVDRSYASTVIPVLKNALRLERTAMGLGVGSVKENWSQVLMRTGWADRLVPFFFYPVHVRRVALELRYLKSRAALYLAARVAAYSGAATAAGLALGVSRAVRRARGSVSAELCPDFDTWADEVYGRCASEYGAMANRQAMTLRVLYPPSDQRYIRLRVQSKSTGRELGWIMVVHRQMENDKYFGNLHVGTLVNGCCELRDVPALLAAGFDYLVGLDLDLVVCNWSHAAWQAGVRSLGFLSGPSNFIFLASPHANASLQGAASFSEIHATRGDCDTPASLMPPAV